MTDQPTDRQDLPIKAPRPELKKKQKTYTASHKTSLFEKLETEARPSDHPAIR